jgi:hypothetical protein
MPSAVERLGRAAPALKRLRTVQTKHVNFGAAID